MAAETAAERLHALYVDELQQSLLPPGGPMVNRRQTEALIRRAHTIGPAACTEADATSNTRTASFENVPAEHDGENTFTFEVAFSEDVGVGYETMRDDAFSVKGGDVTRARRAGASYDTWEISVEPEGRDAVQITLQGTRECGSTGAVCTRGNDRQPLGNSPSATVAGPPSTPLTASFSDMPAQHTGDSFTFALAFSEDFGLSYRTLRDNGAIKVVGGAVRKAHR